MCVGTISPVKAVIPRYSNATPACVLSQKRDGSKKKYTSHGRRTVVHDRPKTISMKKPKRPKTAYNYFQLAVKAKLESSKSTKCSYNEKASRDIGKSWKKLSAAEKRVFYLQARADKERYERQNLEYLRWIAAGEKQATQNSSNFDVPGTPSPRTIWPKLAPAQQKFSPSMHISSPRLKIEPESTNDNLPSVFDPMSPYQPSPSLTLSKGSFKVEEKPAQVLTLTPQPPSSRVMIPEELVLDAEEDNRAKDFENAMMMAFDRHTDEDLSLGENFFRNLSDAPNLFDNDIDLGQDATEDFMDFLQFPEDNKFLL